MPLKNDQIDFPKSLCVAAAKITDGFSFAYIQEAFLASLLVIASQTENGLETDPEFGFVLLEPGNMGSDDDEDREDDLEKLILWREFKKQVKILREDMDNSKQKNGTQAVIRDLSDITINSVDQESYNSV
jgi:hypothetical protein